MNIGKVLGVVNVGNMERDPVTDLPLPAQPEPAREHPVSPVRETIPAQEPEREQVPVS